MRTASGSCISHRSHASATGLDFAADPAWREKVEEDPAGFALFLACDATELSAEVIEEFAGYCVEHGLFWVGTWGPDCERVHDIFDKIDIARQNDRPGVVMSSWHDDETLVEALLLFWYAFPAEGKAGGPARIAISVGSPDWLGQIRRSADHHLRDANEAER